MLAPSQFRSNQTNEERKATGSVSPSGKQGSKNAEVKKQKNEEEELLAIDDGNSNNSEGESAPKLLLPKPGESMPAPQVAKKKVSKGYFGSNLSVSGSKSQAMGSPQNKKKYGDE